MSRPILRYFGGKSKLAPGIIPHIPPHMVYIEPFGGAASVLMSKPQSQIEVYNDLDAEVVNVFRVLQDDTLRERLVRKLRYTPFAESEFRRARTKTGDLVEKARRTIIKSMMGVGADSIHRESGFRQYPHNRVGRGNDTICAAEWGTYVHEAIATFAERLAPGNDGICRTMILQKDAFDVLGMYEGPDTLVYADPPYVHSTRTSSGRYGYEMSDPDHRRLLERLIGLRSMVVLSGYPHAMYDEMLAGWERIERAFRGRTEVLWRNPLAARTANGGCVQQTIFDVLDAEVA